MHASLKTRRLDKKNGKPLTSDQLEIKTLLSCQ